MQFFNFYAYRGQVNEGNLGGLDKVFEIRDRHHRIRRQILRIPHFNWSVYRGGNFLFQPGVKLDQKSIENGLEVQKFLFVCLFLGWLPPP